MRDAAPPGAAAVGLASRRRRRRHHPRRRRRRDDGPPGRDGGPRRSPARPASGDPALREAASRVEPAAAHRRGGRAGRGRQRRWRRGLDGSDADAAPPAVRRRDGGGAEGSFAQDAEDVARGAFRRAGVVVALRARAGGGAALLAERRREAARARHGCTKDMLRAQPQRFRAFTEHVLLRMLAAANDDARASRLGAEEALELLLSISDTHRCTGVLVPVIAKEGPPTLQLAIRLQSKLIGRFSQLQLLSILRRCCRPSSKRSRTRTPTCARPSSSASSTCTWYAPHGHTSNPRSAPIIARRPRQPSHLLSIRQVLGEQLTPHLAELSTSQLKLVTIYINRTTKARADRLEQR